MDNSDVRSIYHVNNVNNIINAPDRAVLLFLRLE